MLDLQAPTPVSDVSVEDVPLVLGNHKISEGYALSLVNRSFNAMENFRSQNHDNRWREHDSLYFGWMPRKVWDGTDIPRSSIPNQIVYDQVESSLPAVSQAIFGTPDWFQVEPGDETVPKEQATYVRDAMTYYLDHCRNNLTSTAQNECKLSFKSTLLYGNGGVGLEWDAVEKRPNIFWVDLRDIYIDPGLNSPNIDDARGVVWRTFRTVDELAEMRENSQMKIPPNAVLNYFATKVVNTVADQTKSVQESIRGINYVPNTTDWMPAPQDRKVEILIYYTRNRIIWVLGREWVAYNEKNPYEFIPFCFSPYSIVVGRFYAQSIADVNGNNQRYIEGLLNARMDELNLALHPPRTMPRNARMTPAQQRWKPGAVYQVDNEKQVSLLQPAGTTTNVFNEISYLEMNAEKRTGINSLSGSGIARPGNANRTATGITAQAQGSANRLTQIVSNIEEYQITPLLYKLYRMLQLHVLPWESVQAMGQDSAAQYKVSGLVFRSPMRFKMSAASKMISKEQLSQVVPFLMQNLVNGPVIANLTKAGKTVDWIEFSQMIQDATGTAKQYRIIRDMTPEEQQATQQEQQAVMQAEQQKAMQADQTRIQIASEKNQTAIQTALISKQPEPPDPEKQEAEAAKIRSEQMMQAIKMQGQRDQMQMKREEGAMKLQLKQAEMQQKAEHMQLQGVIDVQQSQQQAAIDQQNMQNQASLQQSQMQIQAQKIKQQAVMKPPGQTKSNSPSGKPAKTKPKKPE